jgi:Ca2+-binding RTX toxin-like protein
MAGKGSSILLGGPGDDVLTGGSARDLLIGGLGVDRLSGNAADDILIGGTTTHDANDAALLAILAEWNAPRPYAARVANLTDGSGSATRLNNDFFLRLGQTVFDDGKRDTLLGGGGQNWLLLS